MCLPAGHSSAETVGYSLAGCPTSEHLLQSYGQPPEHCHLRDHFQNHDARGLSFICLFVCTCHRQMKRCHWDTFDSWDTFNFFTVSRIFPLRMESIYTPCAKPSSRKGRWSSSLWPRRRRTRNIRRRFLSMWRSGAPSRSWSSCCGPTCRRSWTGERNCNTNWLTIID